DARCLEEVHHHQVERSVGQRGDLGREALDREHPQLYVLEAELTDALGGVSSPVLVVLEAEQRPAALGEPGRGAPRSQFEDAPIAPDVPAEPADRCGNDPGTLGGPPEAGPQQRRPQPKPGGRGHRPPDGVVRGALGPGIVRAALRRSYLGGHSPFWIFFLNVAWRRRASFIRNGRPRIARLGKVSKNRTKAPRQRGTASTGLGLSNRASARSATCSGVNIVPEKEAAASGSSSLLSSMGLQMPLRQRHETWPPLIPERRRSESVPMLYAIAACLLAE